MATIIKDSTMMNTVLVVATVGSGAICSLWEENPMGELLGDLAHEGVYDTRENEFTTSSMSYSFIDENDEKIDTIINFSKKVIDNTIDIEPEYLDVVNDNFWELI